MKCDSASQSPLLCMTDNMVLSPRPDRAGPQGPALGGSLVAGLPAGVLPHLSNGTSLLLLPQEHAQRGESVSSDTRWRCQVTSQRR